MKKYILLIIALVLAIVFCGCDPKINQLEATYNPPPALETPAEYSETEILAMVDNETPYNQLITKEIDIHRVVEKYFTFLSTQELNIAHILDDIGIECLRKTPENILYSVHKVKQGGLLYIFYKYNMTKPKSEETVFSGELIRWFYVQKSAKYEDYTEYISEGSSIEKLIEIDPVSQLSVNIYNSATDSHPSIYYNDETIWVDLYLENGILHLGYQKNSDGMFVLKKSSFDETYTIYDSWYSAIEYETEHVGKILDKDRL